MKKLTVILAFVALGFSAAAQSLNVSSAYEAQNRGYLKKAKGYIDEACLNEQTKEDPQTWFYATLIYCKIGDEISQNTKKGRELKEVAPDWYRKAFNALLAWHQFDTKGEYTNKITPFFAYVSNTYYNKAVTEVSAQGKTPNYAYAMALCDTAIQLSNVVGNKDLATSSYYLAGQCARALGNNEAMKKYFLPLTKSKPNKQTFDAKLVYESMFQLYVKEKDTVNAMKVARSYTRNYPDDFQADALMAGAYLMNGNPEKGVEIMNKAVEKVAADPTKKAEALSIAAGFYEQAKDYTGAEAKYKEALQINANSYAANYGLAAMNFNRAADKITEAGNVPIDDETGLYDKLNNEAKEYFRASVPYFVAAIAYIDGLPADQQPQHKANLHTCLRSLSTVYARLDMLEESKAAEARATALEK